ncbi:EAL domain-containing protein [Geobacter pickeringii]|uniref:EAL domain-containing protein n=1 Tax=Geobacter pickeringii TaxID=345632 RepID=UPI0006904FDB|nr:EAL domain-containing protein [Geobacter pickeringii]
MNNLDITYPSAPIPFRPPLPRVEDSLADCGYLFARFRERLLASRQVGIIGVYLSPSLEIAESGSRLITLFLRMVNGRLTGTIEGGYQAGEGEFFFLLAPEGEYGDEEFRRDLELARRSLKRHLHVLGGQEHALFSPEENDGIHVDGVLLVNQPGETTDNALFRAFQELFGAQSPASRRATEERDEIRRIIAAAGVTPVYQPIFCLATGELHGHEALSRISGSSLFANPDELFEKAQEHQLVSPLDILCRRKALVKAAALGIGGRIFLNACPTLLADPRHRTGGTAELLDDLGIDRTRVTFELTEKALISDYGLFRKLVDHYRDQGYSIAIDDLGAGYAGLGMLTEIVPDYVKLARFLVAGIDSSPMKQALLDSLVIFCDRIGARIVAEGIERTEELDHLIKAGVAFGQGYLLAKPSATPYSATHHPFLHLRSDQP